MHLGIAYILYHRAIVLTEINVHYSTINVAELLDPLLFHIQPNVLLTACG